MQIIFNDICNGALIVPGAIAFAIVYLSWKVFCALSKWRAVI